MKVKLMGCKYFIGVVDGKQIKSGKLYCETRLDDSRNEVDRLFAKGVCSEEFAVDPELVKRIQHLEMPLMVELDIQRVSTGRETKERVTDLRPLEAVRQVAPKAA